MNTRGRSLAYQGMAKNVLNSSEIIGTVYMSKIVTMEEEEVRYGVLIKIEDNYLIFFQKIICKTIARFWLVEILSQIWIRGTILGRRKFGFEVPSHEYYL